MANPELDVDEARQEEEKPPRAAEDTPPWRRRQVLRWLLPGVVVLAVVVTIWQVAAERSTGDGSAYLTEDARITDLHDRVEAAATVAWPHDATAELRAPEGGTVTAVGVRAGDKPASLTTVFEVNDVPLLAFVSPMPLYRDLRNGLEGPDVEALEQALLAAGHDPGTENATFDDKTEEALKNFQDANGLEETGILTRSRALWLPPGGQITAVDIRLGDAVSPGTTLANVAIPERLVVNAEIDQADVARVPQGAPVEVELDALDRPLAGKVGTIALMPGKEGTYRATVQLDAPPDALRAGMMGSARVVVDVREDVIVVPSGAVSGSDRAPTVRVLVDGQPEVREVRLGLVTAEGAEIVAGVAAGDSIIVGEQD